MNVSIKSETNNASSFSIPTYSSSSFKVLNESFIDFNWASFAVVVVTFDWENSRKFSSDFDSDVWFEPKNKLWNFDEISRMGTSFVGSVRPAIQ